MRSLGLYGHSFKNNSNHWTTDRVPRSVFQHIHQFKTFEVPTATFIINGLSEAEQESLRAIGLQQDAQRKYVFRGSPNSVDLQAIYRHSPQPGRPGDGTVTPAGYLAYISALRGLALFSATSGVAMYENDGVNLYTSVPENATLSPSDKFTVKTTSGKAYEVKDTSKTRIPLENFEYMVYAGTKLDGRYVTIKDAKKELVNAPGVFFPYFFGMNLPDKDIMITMFEELFHNAVGSDDEKCSTFLSIVRDGFKSLAATRAGRALSHAYRGLDLAVKGQNVFTIVIQEGVYHGFVLQGRGMESFRQYGKVIPAISKEELAKEIGLIDRKAKLLAEIADMLNSPIDADGNKIHSFTADHINTSRRLGNVLYQIDFDDYAGINDFRANLVEKIDELIFGDEYPAITERTILDFLHFVSTGELAILDKYPCYLGIYLTDQDRVSFGLRIFGRQAPSINVGSAKDRKFVLPRSLNADDPNLSISPDGKRHLQYLPFRRVPVGQAVLQWKALFNNGFISIPEGRKNKTEFTPVTQTHVRISTDPGFAEAYQRIKEISNTTKEAIGSGKRKRTGKQVNVEETSKKGRFVAGDIEI